MIQDIAPHHFDNSWHPRPPMKGDFVFDFSGNAVLMRPDQTFFRYEQLDPSQSYTWLFEIDGIAFYYGSLEKENYIAVSKSRLRLFQDNTMAFAAVTAWQLWHWRKVNQYCGQCGSLLMHSTTERAMVCPKCGNTIYPRLNPAAIVGVINDNGQLLVTQYANGPVNSWALVAGYAEIGETIEECAKREVKEETGIEISELHYYASQPWSFSESLLFGFWARAHGNQTITVQKSELRTALWKGPGDDITAAARISLTAEMISAYQKGDVSL